MRRTRSGLAAAHSPVKKTVARQPRRRSVSKTALVPPGDVRPASIVRATTPLSLRPLTTRVPLGAEHTPGTTGGRGVGVDVGVAVGRGGAVGGGVTLRLGLRGVG